MWLKLIDYRIVRNGASWGNDGRFQKEKYPYNGKATGHSFNTFSRRTIMEIV